MSKNNQINVAVCDKTKAAIEAAADRMGLSVSAWVRLAILAALSEVEQ